MAYGVFIVTRAQSKAQKREKEHVDVYIEGVKWGVTIENVKRVDD